MEVLFLKKRRSGAGELSCKAAKEIFQLLEHALEKRDEPAQSIDGSRPPGLYKRIGSGIAKRSWLYQMELLSIKKQHAENNDIDEQVKYNAA